MPLGEVSHMIHRTKNAPLANPWFRNGENLEGGSKLTGSPIPIRPHENLFAFLLGAFERGKSRANTTITIQIKAPGNHFWHFYDRATITTKASGSVSTFSEILKRFEMC